MLANAGGELLDSWGNAQSVTIKLVAVSSPPFDTISLNGSGAAVATLRECAARGLSNAATSGGMQAEPAIAPAPPPTTINAANVGPFPVGLWVPANAPCRSRSPLMRLRKDHRYERASDAGSWKIIGAQIVFSWRDVPPMATNDMERSAPIVNRRVAIQKLAPDRLSLAGVAWKRCSADPDFYLQ